MNSYIRTMTHILDVALIVTIAANCSGEPLSPTPDLAPDIAIVKTGVEAMATAIAQAAEDDDGPYPESWTKAENPVGE